MNLAKKTLALIFIDPHDFVEQAKIVTRFTSHGAEGHDVFGKAGAAIANAWIQEARSDARIGSNSVDHLVYVRAH